MPLTTLTTLKGATAYLNESINISLAAVEDDQTEEIESMVNSLEIDCAIGASATDGADMNISPTMGHAEAIGNLGDTRSLAENLKKASAGVVLDTTLSNYERSWELFKNFVVSIGKAQSAEEVEQLFPNLPSDLPEWIALWIMEKCDENDIWTGHVKDPSIPRATFNTAQKMRAAMSHKFGRDYQLGTMPWVENPSIPGKYVGNPSLSVAVSQYMISLRRRKARSGEVVTSARAMDESIMKRLWEFGCQTEMKEYGPVTRKQKAENPSEWAGFVVRMMLYLLYLVSMTCLLRYDEALRITWADVVFQVRDTEIQNHWLDATPERFLSSSKLQLKAEDFRIRLNLPFRKTHQYGGIAPFYLYAQPTRPWMCLLRAFALWWVLAQRQVHNLDGYVFRKKINTDNISVNATDAMTSEAFLECFRNNLLDIGIDPRPYGTHSFRRGGCQYLHVVLKWSFRQICNWGGWADNFDNPGTIFKYLLSWNDNPDEEREHYMNPARPRTDPCPTCGRSCHCA